jgi:serine/threonine protein kinase
MDESTQPSTQQVFDPRRLGNQSELCEEDISDIICILQPKSAAAMRAVNRTADYRPQHVRRAFGSGAPQDIALRFGSRSARPSFGFSFGRSLSEADVVIADTSEAAKKISNLHFRIYFHEKSGALMLEDVSQNGTYVDGIFLCGRGRSRDKRRVITNGTHINVKAGSPDDEVIFTVQVPSRDGFEKEYTSKLGAYLRRNSPGGRHAVASAAIPTTSFGMKWDGRPDFKVTNMIGKGAFATVYQLTTFRDGHLLAAKELEKKRLVKDGVLDRRVSNELKIMKSVKHPHIVEYVASHDHDEHLYILMEYVSGGDLQHYLKRSVLSEANAKLVTKQTLSALEYLHRNKITHRDIKPDNILIASEDPFTIKLSDFGLSKVRTENSFAKTFCGTILYCAPEVFPQFATERAGIKRRHGTKSPGHSYGTAVDIWSLGAVIWFALSGSPPFEGMMDPTGRLMYENIMYTPLNASVLDPHGVSAQGKELLVQMMSTDPNNRPSAAECLAHPWIAGTLDIIEEEDEDEDSADRFSQLSINDPTRAALESGSDWDDDADLDNMARHDRSWSRSKRVKTDARFPTNQVRSVSDKEESSEEQSTAEPSNDEDEPRGSPYLFGELSVSALDSAGALGERANRALARNLGANTDHSSIHSSAIFGSLSIPSAIAGATDASLFGAESMVRDLAVASRGSGSYSSVAASSSANSMLATPEMGDSQMLSYISEETPRAKDSVYHSIANDDNTPTRDVGRQPVPLPDTMYPSSAPSHNSLLPAPSLRSAGSQSASATPHPLTPEQSADLAARPARYGTMRTTRDSTAKLLLRLDDVATSWGRAGTCTHVYDDNMDRRVPKVSFVLLFHAPGSEAAAARGEDWTRLAGLHALVKNCSDSAPLWVNDRLLLARTADGRDYCARLFSGDVVTVFQDREGECLRFVCEFGVGESRGVRSVPFEAIVSAKAGEGGEAAVGK